MALELLIKGVDRIGYLERESLRINQDAATYVSTCNFDLIDRNNVITAGVKDTIVVQDPALGQVYFDGTVANVDYDSVKGVARRVKVRCQDNNILVEEAIVVGPHSYVAVADNVIIAALFALYLPGFDSATNVNVVDGAVTIDFQNITLREAMKLLCNQTGGFWFVRASALYYGVEADFGLVGWFLSDTPAPPASYGYLQDTSRKFHGSNMVNEITVIGVLGAAGGVTRQDAASIFTYGTHAAITTDNRISTIAGATKRGDAILAKWSMPRESYTAKTWQGGVIAGQRIRYVNSVYGIDGTYTIRRLSISFPADTALYSITLGDDLDLGLLGQRIFLDKIEEALEPIEPMDLPLSAQGWSHDIEFLPTDFNTVRWTGGTITAADGTTFVIVAGTTGDMNAVTARYVYLDLAISAVALQWNDAVANAVGANRLLIAVCWPSADAVLEAVFQVFGGASTDAGVFINADNIAANCITANEMHANSIQAGHIVAGAVTTIKLDALAVTTGKLAAGAVTADKLSIGSLIFDTAEGLLLLGPHCYIAADEWRSLQQQAADITGAFHQVAGRWIDTRALVIERAVTNLVPNPSFELGVAAGWGTVNVSLAQNADHYFIGDYGLLLTATGAGVIVHYTSNLIACGATDYTLSAFFKAGTAEWVRFGDSGGAAWHSKWFHLSGAGAVGSTHGNVNSASIRRFGQWYRCVLTFTRAIGGNLSLRLGPCPADNVQLFAQAGESVYVDGVQAEADGYPTSYCDGTLGSGYAWTGAAHASTSTRTVTEVNLDAQVGLIANNDTTSYRLVMQMPYDATAVWPQEGTRNHLMNAWVAAGQLLFSYDDSDNKFKVYLNGADRILSAAQTFVAGDWIDLVITLDFAADDYNLYLNGLLAGNDTTVLASVALAQWNLGSSFAATAQAGVAYAEFATFDKVLTQVEVSQLYNLQRPLVDAGSAETPGIYITDGKFRIASSTSGNRIEITPEEIAGYDSAGVKQFYLQSSTGIASCGGGKVWLDANGINLSIAVAPGWIIFSDAGTIRGSILAYTPASPQLYVRSGPAAAAGNWAELYLHAVANNTTTSEIYVRRTNAAGEIIFSTGAVICGRFGVNAAGQGYHLTPFLSLTDGVAAPANVGGRAHLYVDNADGDLKVKFGDGFVRTIAADS